MRSLPRLLAAAAVSVFVLTPQHASAHAELASSVPRDGATLATMPGEVVLELSEQVRKPAFVAVTDADGRRVGTGPVKVDGRKVSSEIAEPTKAGAYTVSYRIVSADAHAVTGSVRFSVTHDSSPSTPSQEGSSPSAAAPTSMAGENVGAKSRDEVSDAVGIVFILIVLVVMTGLSILILLRVAGRAGKD